MWTRYNTDGEAEQVPVDELKEGDIVHRLGQRVRYLGDGAFVYLDAPYVLFDSPEEQQRFANQTHDTYVSVGFSRWGRNVLTEEGMKDTLRTMRSRGGRHFFHHSVQGASWPTWKDSFKKRYHWYR